MSELSDFQIARLAESIVECMLADQGFMWDVAREYARTFSSDDYLEWFQEEEEEEEEAVAEPVTYDIHDVIRAEYTLEPLICIHCGSSEVTYHPGIGDAHCPECGRWQLEEEAE